MTVHVTTSLNPSRCMVGDCELDGPLKLLRGRELPEFRLCVPHYNRLLKRVEIGHLDSNDVARLTNQEIVALVEGDDFKQLIAKLVADERFKQIIRKRVKTKGKK